VESLLSALGGLAMIAAVLVALFIGWRRGKANAWSLFFYPDKSMTLAGYATLQLAALSYCAANGYPPWRPFVGRDDSAAAGKIWSRGFRLALADYLHVRVWVRRWTAADGEARLIVYLGADEGHVHARWQGHPSNDPQRPAAPGSLWSPTDLPWQSSAIEPITLGKLLRTNDGIDRLLSRLEEHAVAPYSLADWRALQQQYGSSLGMVCSDMNDVPHGVTLASVPCLAGAAGKVTVILPSAWGTEPDDTHGFGSWGRRLQIDPNRMFAYFDADHRYHFVQLASPWRPKEGAAMACAISTGQAGYTYLRTRSVRTGAYEASMDALRADDDGEWVCNLVTGSGAHLNNPGHRVVVGSLVRDGCLVKGRAGMQRLVGWLPLETGDSAPEKHAEVRQRAQLRWANLLPDYGRLRPAQGPQTLLWGWANSDGSPAIEPRFARVGYFDRDVAQATLADAPDVLGLVNASGEWVMEPQWKTIAWSSLRFITVQNENGEWGAVGFSLDANGDVLGEATALLPMQPEQYWLSIYEQKVANDPSEKWRIGAPGERDPTDKVIAAIKHVEHDRIYQLVQLAKKEPTLGRLAGVFDAASARDLRKAGAWGMGVRVVRAKEEGLTVAVGEVGSIGFYYPVTLSVFELAQEAPVVGLQSAPHAAIGMRWENICWQAPG
jgi:hypothetical protein